MVYVLDLKKYIGVKIITAKAVQNLSTENILLEKLKVLVG